MEIKRADQLRISVFPWLSSLKVEYERKGGGPRMRDVKVYATHPENNLEN